MKLKLKVAAAGLSACAVAGLVLAGTVPSQAAPAATTTPIKHVVVIFGENVSFDHYFGTYPNAANVAGEKLQAKPGDTAPDAAVFKASPNTPKNLKTLSNDGLLTTNPNQYAPMRLTPDQAMTCDQNHGYSQEQKAYNNGKANKFVEFTSSDPKCGNTTTYGVAGLGMGYYDGNTVAAEWNYAQNFAMSDNSFSTQFGPSTPGALNLISGTTHGAREYDKTTGQQVTNIPANDYGIQSPDSNGVGTVTNDPDPFYDDCSNNNNHVGLDGKNVGDLLNAKGVSWGWFQGGFAPTAAHNGDVKAVCASAHVNVGGNSVRDYSPHHNPFAYYKSTSNPQHLAPANDQEIGHNGQANHNYDITDFNKVVNTDNLPAVSYLKASEFQDGHAGYSDPVDEQNFIVNEVNAIQSSQNWKDTAIVLAYDDSDGWYDHVAARITNGSNDAATAGLDSAICQNGPAAAGGYLDRCGPGTRQPLIVISPYAKKNFVDHTQTEQASILKFIEENWQLGTIGDHSADENAGSLNSMFNLTAAPQMARVMLNASNGSIDQIIDPTPTPSVTPSTASPSQTPTTSAPATATAAPTTAAPTSVAPVTPSVSASTSGPAVSADPSSAGPVAGGGNLASTGFPTLTVVSIAVFIILMGLVFILVTRSRRAGRNH